MFKEKDLACLLLHCVAYLPKDQGVLVLPFVFLSLLTDGLIL